MRHLCCFMFLVASQMAFSEQQGHTAEIARIYPIANGDFVLMFKTQSPLCKNPDNYYYVSVGKNSVTQEGSEKMLSVSLLAASMSKPVTIRFDDASNECAINRLLVNF